MKIKNLFDKVAEFQLATDQPVNTTPTFLDHQYQVLRYALMKEENEEYRDAVLEENMVEILDACVDMMYVLAGTINSSGLQNVFEEAFNRVHDNNMCKVVDGKVLRNGAGKIIKPEGFKAVVLTDLIKW